MSGAPLVERLNYVQLVGTAREPLKEAPGVVEESRGL